MQMYAQDGVAAGYVGSSGKEVHAYGKSCSPFWFWGVHVFTWSGAHVGFWNEGWLRDHQGRAIAWTEKAVGGPAGPVLQELPRRLAETQTGKPPARGPLHDKPEWLDEWSPISAHEFFLAFIDEDGPLPLEKASGLVRYMDARAPAPRKAAPEPEPEPEPAAPELPPIPSDDALLNALNEAIKACADAKSAASRYDVALAAIRWAEQRGRALRPG